MSKLGYIYSSYGKQFNIAIANTNSENVLNGSNLPKNSLIIASNYNSDFDEDEGIYSLIATDSDGKGVRLSYCIQEGNGLVYDKETDTLSLNIDDKTIVSENGKLKFDVSYFIDNETIKINDGKLYIDTENLRVASEENFGVGKIDGRTIKISEDTIYVNTDELDSSNTSTEMYGIGMGDENTISSFEGKLSVNTQNLRPAEGEIKGIVKADEVTTSVLSGRLSVNTQNLSKGITNKYGIVKGDEESIKIQNQMLSVITDNLTKSTESNFGIAKIDGRTIRLNSEGSIYMSSYDELISKIDTYKELKEKYDKKIEDIREEIKVSPYQFNRKDIYLFAVNKTSMTELVKPKHMEEVIEMPEQYAIAEFNIITGCDFYISVNYDRFTNEFPPVTLMNINYNDEIEYPNSEGLGINTIYKSTEGQEKKLIFTFWAKNFNNSALDKSLITSIEITVSSTEDIGEKKTEKYSIVRYNSNYEIPKEKEKKQEEETYTISYDINDSFIEDESHNIYSLNDIIPWYLNNVILYITGINSKTGEKTLLVDRQPYSLFEYSSKAWQGKEGNINVENTSKTTYYNDIPISIATPVTISDRLSVISQVVNIKKEVFPPNTVFQLTNKNKKIDLYSYNLEYIRIKERVFKDQNLNFNINNGIVTDKIENYSISNPNIGPSSLGVSVINSPKIKANLENSGYYLVPLIYTGTSYVPNTELTIAHTNNIWAYPIDSENHDELLNAYFSNVSLNKLDLNILSKNIDIEMTYGTSISNIIAYVKSSYSLNGSIAQDISDSNKGNYIPNIYFNINSAYTSKVKESSYISSSLDESYIGYRMYNIRPEKNILLNHLYEESNWNITYNTSAYFAYYNGLEYDLNNPSLCTNFNVNISIKSEPYLTVSNLSLSQINNSNNQIMNLSATHSSNSVNHVIQTYQINSMNEDTHYITEGEFMLTYKYYITDNTLSSPIIDLQRTEFNENKYSFIYTIQPPSEYYNSNTITQDEYAISYTYYLYNDSVNNLGWKTEPPKNWYKYQILGVEKKLTEIKLDKGYVLEAYFTLNNIQKPSDTIYAYAYSILNDNLFDAQQIYSINTDANNNIYFIPEVGEYYLPSNLQNTFIPNNSVSIKIENINNASVIKNDKVNDSKTITINGYLGIEREDNNSYTYFVSRNSTINDGDGKYLININSNDRALSTHAAISYIYSHSEIFNINNYLISNSISLDYEIDTSKSPNVFYLFTESSENIYTTKFPLANFITPLPAQQRVNENYLANNTFWKTLKQLTSSPRTISGSPYPRDNENYSPDHRITVDLPYLDEVGLFDRFFCPIAVGNSVFNQNLICIKINKDNGVNSKKYYLSTNTDDIVNIINNAVEEHIGYSVNTVSEGSNTRLIYKTNNGLGKKSSSDYTLEDHGIYLNSSANIAQAYRNQWDNLYSSLSTLIDENGNIIIPEEPGPGASYAEIQEFNNKSGLIAELQSLLEETYSSDDVLNNFLNRTNDTIADYSFSKYDNDNSGYDINHFERDENGINYEYKFKYIPSAGQAELGGVDATGHKTENINIDDFVDITYPQEGGNHYQDSILKNLMGDRYNYDLAKENYPLGYMTAYLYYTQYLHGYNLFINSQNLRASEGYENNYYLILNGTTLPQDQNLEFSLITGKNNISEYTPANYNTQYLSTDNISYINSLYYSVNNTSIPDKCRELYNDSEQIFYPSYHYFKLKDSIYNKNINFISSLNIDIIYSENEQQNNRYTNQYGIGTDIIYKPELWQNNISELIINEFNTLNYTNYYRNEIVIAEDGSDGGASFTDYNRNEYNLFVPNTTPDNIFYEVLKNSYRFRYYKDHYIMNNNFGEEGEYADNEANYQLRNNLLALLSEVQGYYSTANTSWDNHGRVYYPNSSSLRGNSPNFYVQYDYRDPEHIEATETTPESWNYSPLTWTTVRNRYESIITEINNRLTTVEGIIVQNEQNNQNLTNEQLNKLNIYYKLKTDFDDSYTKFINELSKYNDIVSKINTEANAFYSIIKHEKEILDSKIANLTNEYDSLLKNYLKSKILVAYKKSEGFSNSVNIYNQNSKGILDIIQGYQQNTIDMYKNNCLKEVNYVLNILLNDLSNINNANLNIYDSSVDLSDINIDGISFLDILPEYTVDFNIFDNIKPRYKIFNNYNILYFDNLFSNGNTQYTLKYSIDNRNKMYDTITQADINSHSVFFGTYKYNISDLSNGAYVHVYEYYNNYFVKEIIPPFKLLDIVSISNGFGLEINTNNSNTKYYKVKYNEDSVLAEMIKTGYPEIGYRKNRANVQYDNYEILYTNSNNISIESNLTLLSLQKNYIVYDNISNEQYICGNREYFVVDPNKNDIIPYYGNMMFTSREFFDINNQKYIFSQNNPKYIVIDYNLYFASSNYNRDDIYENQYESTNDKIGLKDFNDSLKIFTYIKDFYNENNELPSGLAYTKNLIWKYCKNKTSNSISYFKLLNYEWIDPKMSTGGSSSGNDPDIINIGG